MKQAIQSFLTILLLFCAVTTLNATVYSGSCGSNVKYSLDTNTGVLSITGTGSMSDYSSSSSVPWYSDRSYVKTVTISEGVTSIGSNAFYNCTGLTSITIPNSVTSIGDYAFYGCSGLTSITIPNSVMSIGNKAFSGCSGLTSITIPNSVTRIREYAFYKCSGLTSITIPNSVTSIGEYAFYNCKGLKDITVLSSEPPTIYSITFYSHGTLHVLKGCAEAYKSKSYWSYFNIVEDAIDPNIKGTCAAPVISYSNGKISCTCETEGAVCHYTYKYVGEGNGENNGNVSGQITITAYATAEDYADSDTVTKTFDLTGGTSDNCDVNGDGVVNMEDANIVVNKYLGK